MHFVLMFLGICFTTVLAEEKLNQIATAIQKIGDTQCISRVNQVTNFLGFNKNSGAMVMTPKKQKINQRLIPLVMEQTNNNGSISFVSATFSPMSDGKSCQATYDAVTVWSDSCLMVAKKAYTKLEAQRELKTNVTVLSGGTNYKIFLLPAGNMCVAIKKEIVF